MTYTYYPCPLGIVKIGCEDEKIVCVHCMDSKEPEALERQDVNAENEQNDNGGIVEKRYINEPTELSDRAYEQLMEYFEGKRRIFELPLKLQGTEFQIAVWRELLKIPYGETRSYKDIAEAVGRPKAYRAVGMANHNNPIGIVVPCHRVVGADGRLVGYAGGVSIKRALLRLEAQHKEGC